MPLYDWRCHDCGTKFEVLTTYEQSLGSMVCTTCQSSNVRKLLPLVARPARSGEGFADDFGSDDASEDFGDGGCACGGACSCGR